MKESELVVIRTYMNNFEAEVALTALNSAGIEAMITKDDCGGMRPHLWLRGVQLVVRFEDKEQAQEVLESVVDVESEPEDRSE